MAFPFLYHRDHLSFIDMIGSSSSAIDSLSRVSDVGELVFLTATMRVLQRETSGHATRACSGQALGIKISNECK